MKVIIDKNNLEKNICSGSQIDIDGTVGTILITIENKILFVTNVVKDVSSDFVIAEVDGCGC